MSQMKYVLSALIVLLTLSGCDGGATSNSGNQTTNTGTTTTGGGGSTATTQSKLQGSWTRVGQYCGTTYSTGLAEQHAVFTNTQFTIGLVFTCDNQVHTAQIYDVRYDHDTVQVEQTQAASGSCPMTYTSSGSPGWSTYTANVLDTDSPATLQLTIGTCAGGVAKIDVYHKE